MRIRIKDLKKWCETKDDNDVVCAYEYSYDTGKYTKGIDVYLHVQAINRKDLPHTECAYFEEIEVKGKKREYCNKWGSFFGGFGDDDFACFKFKPKTDKPLNFCKKCGGCGYGCDKVNDVTPIYIS